MSRHVLQLIGFALLLVGCSSHPTSDVVRISPTVPGQEKTTYAGKDHLVRWLMRRRSDFQIQHEGGTSQVKLSFRVATYLVERRVWLEQEGRPLPSREVVKKALWENGAVLVTNTVTLKNGTNNFSIATDGDAVDVTPGRPVYLLLDGDIELSPIK